MTLSLYFSSSHKVWDSIDWVNEIEECGYIGWEIVADGWYRLENQEYFHEIQEILSTNNLRVSVHAPYSDLNCASLNYPIWRESIRQICSCIDCAAALTDIVTIHPGYASPIGKLIPDKVWSLQKEALEEIGSRAHDVGILVCLENMGGPREFLCRFPEEIMGMVDGIEGIGLTFDLGHANTIGKVYEFLSFIGRANHLHIHDNAGVNDEHLALGDGNIDWKDIGRAVGESYSGIVVIEGRNLTEAKKSSDAFKRWFL